MYPVPCKRGLSLHYSALAYLRLSSTALNYLGLLQTILQYIRKLEIQNWNSVYLRLEWGKNLWNFQPYTAILPDGSLFSACVWFLLLFVRHFPALNFSFHAGCYRLRVSVTTMFYLRLPDHFHNVQLQDITVVKLPFWFGLE